MSITHSENDTQIASQTTENSSIKTMKNSITTMNFLDFIADTVTQWKVHRCQVTDALISQHQPMKFIYHYEHLSDLLKLQHPLTGQLLAHFDQIMTREAFAQCLGLHLHQVANPWQIKFIGKLVVFYHNPEIALRLHWVNTLKSFEPVYLRSTLSNAASLQDAIQNAFSNWQIVSVEVIQKDPQVEFVYPSELHNNHPVILPSTQFVSLPPTLTNTMIEYFQTHPLIANEWLTLIKAEAQTFAKENNLIVAK